MNTILLSDEDAELFKEFMQKYEIIKAIEKAGGFDIDYGKTTLNFANGLLQNVVTERMGWRRIGK
jgi:hypothetical protein